MYAGSVEMTVKDRLALSPVENSPIPVQWGDEEEAWVIVSRQAFYFTCDCHDLIWNSNEMVHFDLNGGQPAFWRCPLPIDSAR